MIKKEKRNQTTLQKSPYMYYVTNWGFVEQATKSKTTVKSKTESLTTR